MINLQRRNVCKNTIALSALANSAKWATPVILSQAVPTHAQSSEQTLSVTPEMTLGALDSRISVNGNNVPNTASGNTAVRLGIDHIAVNVINMNLPAQLSSINMDQLDVTFSGTFSITSMNGPSETNLVEDITNQAPISNYLINHGITNFPAPISGDRFGTVGSPTVIFEYQPILVAPATPFESIDYLVEFNGQVTINSPVIDVEIMESVTSNIITISHENPGTASPYVLTHDFSLLTV